MYMKRFIEKLYGRKLHTGFYFEVMILIILTFILIVFYSNLSSNKDSYGEYKSYYNIAVEIKDGRINGKLNKYIEIKTICVIKLPGESGLGCRPGLQDLQQFLFQLQQ